MLQFGKYYTDNCKNMRKVIQTCWGGGIAMFSDFLIIKFQWIQA